MKLDNKQVGGLQKLLTLLEPDALTRKEFTANFARILKFLKEVKAKNQAEVEQIKKLADELSNKLKDNHNNLTAQLKGDNVSNLTGVKNEFAKLINNALKDQEVGMNLIRDKVRNVKSGKDADETKIVKAVLAQIILPEYKETVLDDASKIVDKLKTLKRKESLPISAIKGLRKTLEELKKRKTTYVSGGTGQGGKIVKFHDLSASLDGSTKTFAMPAFWRILSVQLSSFPNVLRDTTDYIADASAMTIEFTSEIDAATSLATGQTCVILYSEY